MITETSAAGRREQTDGVVIRERQPGRHKRDAQSYSDLERDLIVRLDHLKAEARQVCEAWLADVDGDVSTLVDFLDGSSEVRKARDAKASTMEAWAKILDGLSTRPHKGRKKDLRRIDRTVRALMKSAFE